MTEHEHSPARDPARSAEHFRTEDFARLDPRPDPTFYELPRYVVHIDDGAIAAVGTLVARLAPPAATVLDLMSSYRSHLPASLAPREVVGIGLNAAEMVANPQLTAHHVHDMNAEPRLPVPDERFDLALCTVSVQYLTRPLEVFAAVRQVLRPDGVFLVTFSNRCFPTKAIRLWLQGGDADHLVLVRRYFQLSGGWSEPEAAAYRPPDGDPLYGVWARRQAPGATT
jgi:SAM-dependent methyltransferase